MLAELYLSMAGYPLNDQSKYADAARMAGEVIEQADYYNFALQADFATLWDDQNRHNSENVFVLTPAKVISRYMSDYEYTDFANNETRYND